MDETTQVDTAVTPEGQEVEIVAGSEKPAQIIRGFRMLSGSHVLNPLPPSNPGAATSSPVQGGIGGTRRFNPKK